MVQNVAGRFGFAIRRLENSVSPTLNGQERIKQRKERDGLCLSFAVSEIHGTLTLLTAPTAIRLWEPLTF